MARPTNAELTALARRVEAELKSRTNEMTSAHKEIETLESKLKSEADKKKELTELVKEWQKRAVLAEKSLETTTQAQVKELQAQYASLKKREVALETELAQKVFANQTLSKSLQLVEADVKKLGERLHVARVALRDITEVQWPRLSRPLISRANKALTDIRAHEEHTNGEVKEDATVAK